MNYYEEHVDGNHGSGSGSDVQRPSFAGDEKTEKKDEKKGGHVLVYADEKKDEKKKDGKFTDTFADEKKDEKKKDGK